MADRWPDNVRVAPPKMPGWLSAGGRPAHYYFTTRELGLSLCGIEYRKMYVDTNPEIRHPHCKKCERLIAEDGTL